MSAETAWPPGARYAQFEAVDLGAGVAAVVLDPLPSGAPQAYIVEIFLAQGSCGDGVTDMVETTEGLAPLDPAEFAEICRQGPNIPEEK